MNVDSKLATILKIKNLILEKSIMSEEKKRRLIDGYKKFELDIIGSTKISEFYEYIDEYLCLIGDPHTRCYYKKEEVYIYNIDLVWHKNKLYIGDTSEKEISVKYRLVKEVNGYNIKDIKERYKEKFPYIKEDYIEIEISNDIMYKKRIFCSSNSLDIKVTSMSETKNEVICFYPVNAETVRRKILKSEIYQMRNVDARLLSKNTLFIKILTFNDSNISEKIISLCSSYEGFSNIIIDLRSNSGGFIEETKKTLGLFVDSDVYLDYKLKYKQEHKDCKKNILVKSGKYKKFQDKKIYIFIDKYTASSSEFIIVAGLKKFSKAVIVGTESAGVFGIASLFTINNEAYLKVSTKIFTEGEKGIMPDIYLETSKEVLMNPIDIYYEWYKSHIDQLVELNLV